MNKFIWVAFAFMGLAFYELSGGADFEPGDTSLTIFAKPNPVAIDRAPQPEMVARADTALPLADITTPLIAPSTQPETAAEPESADSATIASLDAALPASEDGAGDTSAPSDITAEVVAATVAERVEEPAARSDPDFRFVDGDRVNLRGGPGTDYAVVGKLMRNDMIEVIEDEGNGWLHLRVSATGDEGWMASRLLTAPN